MDSSDGCVLASHCEAPTSMQPRARAARLSGSQRLTYCAADVVVAETEQIPMDTSSISRIGIAMIVQMHSEPFNSSI